MVVVRKRHCRCSSRFFKAVEEQGRVTGRFGSVDDVALAVKALVGSWIIAGRRGDEQLSEELDREIRFALCSPSTRLRNEVAEYLGQRGRIVVGDGSLRSAAADDGTGQRGEDGALRCRAKLFAAGRNTNISEAARWFDLAVGGTLDSMNFRPGAYITLPLYVRRWAIEAAIEQKDVEQVDRHLKRILQLDPLDIDFAERLLPEMRKAGMDETADQALDQIMEHGLRYVDAFSFDAMTCNNLAWVAAMNNRRLDDALRLAELAVYVEPDSAIYRDTLAEVLFLLDRKAGGTAGRAGVFAG